MRLLLQQNNAVTHWWRSPCCWRGFPPRRWWCRRTLARRCGPRSWRACSCCTRSVLYCTALYCTALYCTVLITTLHSIALYSIPSCIKPHGIFAMHGILICSFILFGSYFTITWIDNRYIFRKPKSLIDSRLLYAKLKIDRSTDQVSALVAISTYLQPAPLRAPQPGHWGGHTAHSRHTHPDTRGPTAASLCALWILTSVLLRESERTCVQSILQWLQYLVLISWSVILQYAA